MGYEGFIDIVEEQLADLRESQGEALKAAAVLIAESIMKGGIVQSFGSGHSRVGSSEFCIRAGGLIPAKEMYFPNSTKYEMLEGVGTRFMEHADIRPEDVFVVTSFSGRNPLPIEVAMCAKEKGVKVIAITSVENSRKLSSRHSSGKHLYELADVVLDIKGEFGDAAMSLPGLEEKVCATSTITTTVLTVSTVLEAISIMLEAGFVPPVYMSSNVDGGPEYNDRLVREYSGRLFRV